MKLATFLMAFLAVVTSVSGAVISIDFNNTTDSAWIIDGTETAGPLDTANWNTTSSRSGTGQALVDDTGSATGATLDWNSNNTWTSGEGNGDTELALSHAYLDDGPSGANKGPSITVNNIPYDQYVVYGLFSSGQNPGGTVEMVDFIINGASLLGGGTATAYGRVVDNRTNNIEAWTEIVNGSVIGNYWTFATSGSTLTVTNGGRNGSARGSITGLLIQQVPEPSSFAIVGLLSVGLLATARKVRH